jgi:NAD(P)-dependent dehydrogenase (short-subunit alcohol dehydrogenase family)
MNKTVLIIGASGGIGTQVAKDLLNNGYTVIGTHSKTPLSIQNITSYQLNLLSNSSIKDFIKKIDNTNLYAVINCAGIVEYEGKSIERDIEIWDRTIQINLSSNFVLAKYLQSKIETNGKFIMISSTDAIYGSALTASYAVSKAGINSLTKSLSLLFKDKNISVNAIAPGWVNTRMISDTGEDFIRQVTNINPLKRIAEPKDISNLISFLLKPESSYINGQIITVDGGYTNQDPTLLIEEDAI